MTIERYHGSTARSLAQTILSPIGKWVLARYEGAFRRADDLEPPEVIELLHQSAELCRQQKWGEALARVRRAADIVERQDVPKRKVGGALVRLGDCGRGLRLMSPPLSLGDTGAREWRGEDLAGQTLVVWQRTASDMGTPIRLARFVAAAERRAAHCIVGVEARLVPLFQRTFSKAEIRAAKSKSVHGVDSAALVTSFEALAADCIADWASIAATFVPLRPDGAAVAEFRQRYRQDCQLPIVGISWGSKNSRKDVPDFASWAQFIQAFPARFVSLQYGSVSGALKRLREHAPDKLIEDATVDQLVDMDRFAAQVASLDAVISISNTAAHLAGALDVPMVLIRDDRFAMVWPLSGTESGWYPSAAIVRRQERAWPVVLKEAAVRLTEKLARPQ